MVQGGCYIYILTVIALLFFGISMKESDFYSDIYHKQGSVSSVLLFPHILVNIKFFDSKDFSEIILSNMKW